MSAGDLEGLFDLDRATQRRGTAGEKGTGLGLIICKEFAERNGGRLSVESRPGEGSAFTLELPLAEPDTASLPAPEALGDAG